MEYRERRDFFISYTKVNRAEAEWIADTLKRYGYSVFIQARDINAGESFVEKMEAFIACSDSFIAVWSQQYEQSRFAMLEFRAAFALLNKRKQMRFLPVCVEAFPLPALYTHIVHVDLYGVDEAEKTRRLLDAVGYKGKLSQPAAAKPFADAGAEKPKALKRGGAGGAKWVVFALPAILAVVVFLFGWRQKGGDNETAVNMENRSGETGLNEEDAFVEAGLSAEELFYLGFTYEHGYKVDIDYEKARYYYEQAAEAGDNHALCYVASLYQNGLGVDVDYGKALDYYQQAAQHGDGMALFYLGLFYQWGMGVEQDYAKAREYYEQAALRGSQAARKNLKDLSEQEAREAD